MEPITLGFGPRTVRNTAPYRGDKAEMHASITWRVVTFGPGAGVDAPCRGPEAGAAAPWSSYLGVLSGGVCFLRQFGKKLEELF